MRVVTYNYDSISSNFLDDLKAFHLGDSSILHLRSDPLPRCRWLGHSINEVGAGLKHFKSINFKHQIRRRSCLLDVFFQAM